jgi:hypothetical protein
MNINFFIKSIVTGSRRWRAEGVFKEATVSLDGTSCLYLDPPQFKHLFLFNDYFLYTKPVGTIKEPKYEVEFHLPILGPDKQPLVSFEGNLYFPEFLFKLE